MELPVDVASIANPDDGDNQLLIDDFVENAVVALAKAILLLSGELFATGWSRLSREALDPLDDALTILGGYGLQLLGGRPLKRML